jgi:hypothetical protein
MRFSSEHVSRWIVIVVLGAATMTMFLISMRGNYLYGHAVGQSDEKRVLFAWANVAADVWKSFGLIAVTVLWRHRHRRVAIAGAAAWLVCLLSGVNSAIGVYVQDRAALTGMREAQHATYKDAQKELGEIEEKLRALGHHRSAAEVDALIAATFARPIVAGERVRGTVGSISTDCKKSDPRTAEACSEIAVLRRERAIVEDAKKLEQSAQELRREIVNSRERGSALPPDPVGEFYAWATRGLLSVRDVGFGFPLFFALLIEVVSAFGPITVMRFAELSVVGETKSDTGATERVVSRHDALRLVAPERVDERVALWMSQRATPSPEGGAITLEEMHDDYRDWCARHGFPPSTLPAFSAEFDRLRTMAELSGKIRKFGNRFYGIALVSDKSLAASGQERVVRFDNQ